MLLLLLFLINSIPAMYFSRAWLQQLSFLEQNLLISLFALLLTDLFQALFEAVGLLTECVAVFLTIHVKANSGL